MHDRPLCHFPSRRVAPPELVRALRSIKPTAELVWLRRGQWCLGTVNSDSPSRIHALKSLELLYLAADALDRAKLSGPFRRAASRKWGDKVAFQRLKLQGFIDQQTFPPLLDTELGLIERWFREASWTMQHCYNATWRAAEAQTEVQPEHDAKLANVTDRSRLREAWRMGFRNPVSVRQPGLPWKPSPGAGLYDSNGIRIQQTA
jgi:hypothetical protein